MIKENSRFYKGVDIKIGNYREYTDGTLAPHIIGVTGVISAEEYAELKKDGYGMDDIVGKTGIEQLFEKQLKGKNGTKIVTTALDGTQTTVTKGLENGDNVFLTIDAGLQKVTQDALAAKIASLDSANKGGGATVVMNCKTGDILAIATYPSYDLNTYYKNYSKLAKDANSPLYNRALLSTYAPGSTAKVQRQSVFLRRASPMKIRRLNVREHINTVLYVTITPRQQRLISELLFRIPVTYFSTISAGNCLESKR